MVLSFDDLQIINKNYVDLKGKIKRDIESGKIISLKKGLYENDPNTPGHYLSSFIYGPSYLSFDYALSKYSLIPEAVYNTYTSATFNKSRKKSYKNNFGIFTYQDIPKNAYPYGILTYVENEYVYHIATPEKALCDKIYSVSPVKTMKALKELLFLDLRIDENEFNKLNKADLIELCSKYQSTNLNLLLKILIRK